MKQFILTHKVLCIVLACVLLAGVTCAIVLPIALKHEHAYATEWSSDKTNHWHAATCEHTDFKKDEAAHDFGEGVTDGDVTTYTCKVCGFKKTETVSDPSHEHTYATEWSSDETNHWHAATCEHTDLRNDEEAHDFGEGVTVGDVTTYTCEVCDFEKTETENSTEPKDNALGVKSAGYVYNAKSQPIVVTASNKEGMVVKYVGVGETVYEESTTAPKDAGTYQYTITIPATAEWKAVEVTGTYTIEKYELTELYENVYTKEYDGSRIILVGYKPFEGKDLNIPIWMKSKGVCTEIEKIIVPERLQVNYMFDQSRVKAAITPKKLSGLNFSIRIDEIDDEEGGETTITRDIEVNGEKIGFNITFSQKELCNEEGLELSIDGKAGATCKIEFITPNPNYVFGDDIGSLDLDRT